MKNGIQNILVGAIIVFVGCELNARTLIIENDLPFQVHVDATFELAAGSYCAGGQVTVEPRGTGTMDEKILGRCRNRLQSLVVTFTEDNKPTTLVYNHHDSAFVITKRTYTVKIVNKDGKSHYQIVSEGNASELVAANVQALQNAHQKMRIITEQKESLSIVKNMSAKRLAASTLLEVEKYLKLLRSYEARLQSMSDLAADREKQELSKQIDRLQEALQQKSLSAQPKEKK